MVIYLCKTAVISFAVAGQSMHITAVNWKSPQMSFPCGHAQPRGGASQVMQEMLRHIGYVNEL